MNILISTLVSSTNPNGLRNYIISLIDTLQEKTGSEHNFYILTNKEFSGLIDLKKSNFKSIIVDIPHNPRFIMRPIYFLWQNLLAYSLCKRNGIDIFHSPNPIPIFFKPAKYFVVTIHDFAEYAGYRHNSLKRWLRRVFNFLSINKADKVLTVSNFSEKELTSYYPYAAKKVNVIYPQVKTRCSSKSSYFNDLVKKEYFLCIGGDKPYKNVERTIEAFLSLENKGETNLLITGSFKRFKLSTSRVSQLEEKGVFFLGVVSDSEMEYLFRNAFTLVYVSLYEGFGFPILEAMANGVPVITSNRASMIEVGGDATVLVEPEDTVDITRAMQTILTNSNLRKEKIELGKSRASSFKEKHTGEFLINFYESMLQ